MNTDMALFDVDLSQNFSDSVTTKTIRALIREIDAAGRMTPRLQVFCSQAVTYAGIMDNPKSAVAAVQAGVQLTEIVEKYLSPTEEATSEQAELLRLLESDPFA